MYENMMSPVMYQDIGTSFAMQPMPMMGMPGMMPGMMYPGYGVGTLRPALSEDKFQKFEEKKQGDKNLAKNLALIVGGTLLAMCCLSKAKKVLTPAWNATKNFFSNLFKKSTPTP